MQKHFKRLAQSATFTKIVLPIILVAILAVIGFATFGGKSETKTIKAEEAKTIAENFINDFLMMPGTKAKITEITEEDFGLYKLKVDITSDIVESYLSKDGKFFFPQAFNIEEMRAELGTELEDEPVTVIPTSAKPIVELFTMSHCPYGTQIEKGLLPVINLLGNKIDFKLKFVDYAMHGETELKEQMVQYCIQEKQSDKLMDYLKCFLVDGDTNRCLTEAGIKQSTLNSCVTAVDKEYKITENFKNKVGFQGSYPGFDIYKADNEKYGVSGSPTLVINSTNVRSGRSASELLSVICSSFDVAPEECNTNLSGETPSPGFGNGTSNSATAAECN